MDLVRWTADSELPHTLRADGLRRFGFLRHEVLNNYADNPKWISYDERQSLNCHTPSADGLRRLGFLRHEVLLRKSLQAALKNMISVEVEITKNPKIWTFSRQPSMSKNRNNVNTYKHRVLKHNDLWLSCVLWNPDTFSSNYVRQTSSLKQKTHI